MYISENKIVMIKSKLSWVFIIPVILFLIFMVINFAFIKTFWFGGSLIIIEPFLRIGIFMISLLGSLFILYDLSFNLTLLKLKDETFEIRTIFKKDEIPYRAIYYLYEEDYMFGTKKSQILTIQTKKSRFRLRNCFDSNYDQVKDKIIEKAEQYVNLLA